MREIEFHVLSERAGDWRAEALQPPLKIAAPTLEELQHEAREALIQHFGPAHCTYRVRIRRATPSSRIRSWHRPAASCCP